MASGSQTRISSETIHVSKECLTLLNDIIPTSITTIRYGNETKSKVTYNDGIMTILEFLKSMDIGLKELTSMIIEYKAKQEIESVAN